MQAGPDHLDRNGLLRLVVVALVDRAHGSMADLVVNVIRSDRLAGQHDFAPLGQNFTSILAQRRTRIEDRRSRIEDRFAATRQRSVSRAPLSRRGKTLYNGAMAQVTLEALAEKLALADQLLVGR